MHIIESLALKPYCGIRREGSRHSFIIEELIRRGCSPSIDRYGNIWVEKGSGKPVTLFSSHIDVDYKIPELSFSKSGEECEGILDNAVGVYLNLLLAEKGPKKGRAIYVFTASEEEDRDGKFAKSAREVLLELERRGITPDLAVSIDVTYPALRGKAEDIDWNTDYHDLFDVKDKSHCFLEGFESSQSRAVAQKMAGSFNNKVKVRDFAGEDEACVYEEKYPAVAFGPVVYGHFDEPGQKMPLKHMETALEFLKRI